MFEQSSKNIYNFKLQVISLTSKLKFSILGITYKNNKLWDNYIETGGRVHVNPIKSSTWKVKENNIKRNNKHKQKRKNQANTYTYILCNPKTKKTIRTWHLRTTRFTFF